jgi:hypothetical protein
MYHKPLSEFYAGHYLIVAKCSESMLPPIMVFSIQVHSGKFDGFHFPHGIELKVCIQLLHPCLCCHLGRTIKVWDFHLACSSLKIKISHVVRSGLISKLELPILIQRHLPLDDHVQAVVFPSTLCHLVNKVVHLLLLHLFIYECGKVWYRVIPAPHFPLCRTTSLASF